MIHHVSSILRTQWELVGLVNLNDSHVKAKHRFDSQSINIRHVTKKKRNYCNLLHECQN